MISDVPGSEVSFASQSMRLTPRSAPGQGLRDREMEASSGSSYWTPSGPIHNTRYSMRGPRRVDRGVCRIGNRRKSGSFAYARRPKFLMRSIQTSRSHNRNGGGNTRAALCISLRKVRGSLPPRLYREKNKSKLPDKPLVPQGATKKRNGWRPRQERCRSLCLNKLERFGTKEYAAGSSVQWGFRCETPYRARPWLSP